MKRVAVCFRGLHDYFLASWQNLNEMILQDLRQEYDVDVFLNTYKTEMSSVVENLLRPVMIYYAPSRVGQSSILTIVPCQILECCEMIRQYEQKRGFQYDYILITRFDLTFNTHFRSNPIDYEKINMECLFDPPPSSGDNVFFFKREYLDHVASSVVACMKNGESSHVLYKYFNSKGDLSHYIGGTTTKGHPHYDVMFRFTRYLV